MKTPTEWRTEWRLRCTALEQEASEAGLDHPTLDVWEGHFEKLITDVQADAIAAGIPAELIQMVKDDESKL
jgi:hypothetical protein